MFCSARDSISIQQKTHVIYKVPCPGWNEDDLRKTDCNLVTRLDKNASREDQPMYQHLLKCENFAHIIHLHGLPDIMLQQQRSITNNTLLMQVFLTSVF